MSSDDSDEDFRTLRRRPRKNREAQYAQEDAAAEGIVDLATTDLDALSLGDFLKAYERRPRPQQICRTGAAHPNARTRIPSWSELETNTAPYPYIRMLQRASHCARERNPEAIRAGEGTIQILGPKMQKDGPRKTVITNFRDVCASMARTEENVMDFLTKELSTTGNLDSNQCLVLKGSYRDHNLEKALRKYADEFIVCYACGSGQTTLSRDPVSRLFELKCEKCNASRNVSSATAGFAAQTTRRAIQRMKQG